jgi:hypothetical protein
MVFMTDNKGKDNGFGEIAVEMNFVDQKVVDKALVVQSRIFEKTRVSMPIGEILIEMGAITAAQRNEILQMQRDIEGKTESGDNACSRQKQSASPPNPLKKEAATLDISVSKEQADGLGLYRWKGPATEFEISDVKVMLHAEGILYGIADDEQIKAFLHGDIGLGERWTIASGTDPIPDTPPQIKYHFDTDPLKIGTLTEDGLMDWKERGRVAPGQGGRPARRKNSRAPKAKRAWMYTEKKFPSPSCGSSGSNAAKAPVGQRTACRCTPRLSGIPKLSVTGEISVMPTLHIQGDISLKTGHVTFDGHIEVAGAVEKGYRVKGGSLRANEIRDAEIDVDWRYYRDKRYIWYHDSIWRQS